MRFRARFLAVIAVTALVAAPAQAQQSAGHGEGQREQWQKVDEIFQAMGVKAGAIVADVGAGDGFFTTRLSKAVGNDGRVLAVDVAADALRRLRGRITDDALSNVEVVQGTADDPKLPSGSVDAALIVNAYHEMAEHQAMLTKIRSALKPSGRLVIVEPITSEHRGSPREDQTRRHEIAPQLVLDDARAAGFAVVALKDPFTERPNGHGEEWMLVLAPSAATAAPAPSSSTVAAAQVFSSTNEDWKAPELRISVEEFKRLQASGGVLVLDVRDPRSYRAGHLSGAVLMTPEEMATPEGVAKLKAEKRQIVAYCS